MSVVTSVPAVDVTLVGTDWWANGSVVAAAVGAALIAALVGVRGYREQKRAARRDERARMYATAVQAVEDYLEFPYRIRRRDGSAEARNALTARLSDVQSSIAYHQALLKIHGSKSVAELYDTFVAVARQDAGPAMTQAWGEPASRHDADVPLGGALDRAASDTARERLIDAMRADLGG